MIRRSSPELDSLFFCKTLTDSDLLFLILESKQLLCTKMYEWSDCVLLTLFSSFSLGPWIHSHCFSTAFIPEKEAKGWHIQHFEWLLIWCVQLQAFMWAPRKKGWSWQQLEVILLRNHLTTALQVRNWYLSLPVSVPMWADHCRLDGCAVTDIKTF